MDFLGISQILALLCLLQNGFVQFYLLKESARGSILASVPKAAGALKLLEADSADHAAHVRRVFETAAVRAKAYKSFKRLDTPSMAAPKNKNLPAQHPGAAQDLDVSLDVRTV